MLRSQTQTCLTRIVDFFLLVNGDVEQFNYRWRHHRLTSRCRLWKHAPRRNYNGCFVNKINTSWCAASVEQMSCELHRQFGYRVVINKNPRKITAPGAQLTDKCGALSNKTETKEETVDWHFSVPLLSCFLCLKYNAQMAVSLSGGGSTQTTNSD